MKKNFAKWPLVVLFLCLIAIMIWQVSYNRGVWQRAYNEGYQAGFDHALNDAEFFIVDYDAPEYGYYDLNLHIGYEDGPVFERGLYVY